MHRVFDAYRLFQDLRLARPLSSIRNQTWWGNPEKPVTKEEFTDNDDYVLTTIYVSDK